MKKINIKKSIKRIAFVDTETIGSIFCPDTCVPFDISIKWYDNRTSKVLKQKCYLVRPFFNNKYIMGSSFSAKKYRSYYLKEVGTNKEFFVGSVNEIMKDIQKYNKKFGVKIASAYKDSFDKTVIERLCKEFGSNNPFKNMDWLDLMQVVEEVTSSQAYINECKRNKDIYPDKEKGGCKFVTKGGRVRTTAESVYCFIVQDPAFKESHTGLEDLNIELAIYEFCKSTNFNKVIELNTPKVHWSVAPKVPESF